MLSVIKYYLVLLFTFSCLVCSMAQEEEGTAEKQEPPALKMTRAEEDYSYLRNKENHPYEKDPFDVIKNIALNKSGEVNVSFGGQFRPRFEHFSNRLWVPEEDEDFYSQRLAFHTNLVLGKYLRLFGELYHGYTSNEEEFTQYDEIDVFQAFAEVKLPIKNKEKLSLRLGRQEMGLGAARLVGIREGPNIRRSYDMGRLIFAQSKTKVQAFYGREVIPLFEAFDNEFSLFDEESTNPSLWGLYTQFPIKGLNGMNEIYYLGFDVDNASFNDVTGAETRHTFGLRRVGKLGEHWRYNSEIVYQLGEIGEDDINAFSFDIDWHYDLNDTDWKWSPGLKLEYISGDKDLDDGEINSFNPMFVNPAYYSLAATITPVNLIGIHPSISARPSEKLFLYAEWAIFWRASENDALYSPTRFINRPANNIEEMNIGHQFGFKLQYEVNRHISMDLDVSYFVAGEFLEQTGEVDDIFHFAPTLSYRF